MTTGEKIKHFRNLRGISQETLGQLSGINSATIKKYEYGIRNPKPDQLMKIANALGISINVFMDFDIETVMRKLITIMLKRKGTGCFLVLMLLFYHTLSGSSTYKCLSFF